MTIVRITIENEGGEGSGLLKVVSALDANGNELVHDLNEVIVYHEDNEGEPESSLRRALSKSHPGQSYDFEYVE